MKNDTKSLGFDASLNYQRHQRDYPFIGVVSVVKGLNGENKEFFNASPNPIFLVVKEGVFYHFMSEKDGYNRCKGWLSKNNLKELKKTEKDYDKKLKEFNKFYKENDKNLKGAIKKLHQYFIDFTNIVLIGFEMPEYCGEEISKELYDFCINIRKKYEDIHKRCCTLEFKILKKIERKYGLKKGILVNLTTQELEEFFISEALPKNIEQRSDFFIYRNSFGKEELFFDKNLWKEFEIDIINKEIKGQIAYPGIKKGYVRIIKKIEDAKKFKNGEILIASMTDPRYVFIMKKAAAFVTDEGGITCHASIVARELKKPCVIGTKIATEVLKDGDLVEVDANKGIVKILKKYGN